MIATFKTMLGTGAYFDVAVNELTIGELNEAEVIDPSRIDASYVSNHVLMEKGIWENAVLRNALNYAPTTLEIRKPNQDTSFITPKENLLNSIMRISKEKKEESAPLVMFIIRYCPK
jgi:hypothetical protein